MAVPNWSPVLPGDHPDHAEAPARHLDRENAALRELVTVYRYLSGLALQDADLAGIPGTVRGGDLAAGGADAHLIEANLQIEPLLKYREQFPALRDMREEYLGRV
jgi:hypothetical protein